MFPRCFLFPVMAGCLAAGYAWPAEPPAAFRDFDDHVRQYLKVRHDLPAPLPRRKTTSRHNEIAERQRALAAALRNARANAKTGDIFTPEVADQFRRAIHDQFAGPNGARMRKTIRQGEPDSHTHLAVNDVLPAHDIRTSVPPTLLIALPLLPQELAYRIIGHDFVLQDTEARTVVDFIPNAIP